MKELIKRLDAEYGFNLNEEEIELIAKQAEESDLLFQGLYKVDITGLAPIMKVDKKKADK